MRLILLAVFPFLLTTCAEPGTPPPPPEAETLAPVLVDLHLAHALSNEVPALIRDSMQTVFFENTLAEHNLDQATFDSLLWIVRAEPAWVDSLYSRVGVMLTKKEVAKNSPADQ